MSLCRDGDAKILWFKCLLMGMSWCKCFLQGCYDANIHLGVCLWCECPLVGMSWCKCPLVGMPWCRCSLVGMSWCKCFDAKTNRSKIPFIFKTRLPQRLKSKYFQDLIYYSRKVIFFFFDLRLSKNWWSLLENLQIRHWLGIWWSGSKDLFSQLGWAKRIACFQCPFLKNEFFENQAL